MNRALFLQPMRQTPYSKALAVPCPHTVSARIILAFDEIPRGNKSNLNSAVLFHMTPWLAAGGSY